jgi:hypothetical protein
MSTHIRTFWDGTDAGSSNWSGVDPFMSDDASAAPQAMVAASIGGGTLPTSSGGPPSDNVVGGGGDVRPNPTPGGSDPAPLTWVLPTPLPSSLPSDPPAGGSSDGPPTPALPEPDPPQGSVHLTWVLPTPLPTLAPLGSDPLAAFLDGLQGMSSSAGPPPNGPAAWTAPMLSNGLNADAGVAQLVSALASLRDGNSAFDAGPFAASSDPVPQMTIAASSQGGSS